MGPKEDPPIIPLILSLRERENKGKKHIQFVKEK